MLVGSLFAADEIHVDYESSATLYAARFQPAGNVFVTSGLSDQIWSTAGDYDVTMTENGTGGHFVGSFDALANIGDGTYKITVYEQLGGSPADSDRAIYVGTIVWKDSAEFDPTTVLTSIETLAQLMVDIMEGDLWTNTATTPWRSVIRTKGTENALVEKELFGIDGDNITAVYQRIGQQTEPN